MFLKLFNEVFLGDNADMGTTLYWLKGGRTERPYNSNKPLSYDGMVVEVIFCASW